MSSQISLKKYKYRVVVVYKYIVVVVLLLKAFAYNNALPNAFMEILSKPISSPK